MPASAPQSVAIAEIIPTVFLSGTEPNLYQAMDLKIRNDGPPAVICVDGKIGSERIEIPPFDVPEGESEHRILVPAVKTSRKAVFSIRGSSEKREIVLEPPRKWTVYLVQTAHFDPGYTDLPSLVMREYESFFDDILRFCEETEDWSEDLRFRYQIEQAWVLEHVLKNGSPAKVDRIVSLLREGRLEVNALYANIITELCSGEELARLLYPAFRIGRELGIPIRTAEHNDIPGVSWGVAAALAAAGIRYFIPGLPGYFSWVNPPFRTFWDESAIRPNDVPTAFRWEAPNGDSVLFYNHDQGAGGQMDRGLGDLFTYLRKLETRGYPYTCLRYWLNGAGRDNAPPALEFVLSAREHQRKWTWPRLIVSTNTPFCEHLSRELGDEVRTFRGEFPNTDYPIGATSAARETGINRLTHDLLSAAERYAVLASRVSDAPYPRDLLFEAWENVMKFDEHAFGLAYPLGPGHEACRAEKNAYAYWAAGIAEDVKVKMLNKIADSIRIEEEGYHLVVFNPTARPRTDVVNVPGFPMETASRPLALIPRKDGKPGMGIPTNSSVLGRNICYPPGDLFEKGFDLVDVDTGEPVSCQLNVIEDPLAPVPFASERFNHGRRRQGEPIDAQFTARDVPAMGYRLYRLVLREEPSETRTDDLKVKKGLLENRFYRVEVDPKTGRIVSILDKETKRELVDKRAKFAVNQLVARKFMTGEIEVPGKSRVSVGKKGPVSISLRIESEIPGVPQLIQEIILYRDVKRIDFANRLLKDADPMREYFFAFPFAVRNPQFRYEGGLSVIEPVRDQLPGTNTDAATVQHYAAVFNEKTSVTWTGREAPIALFSELWPGYVSPAHHNVTPPGYVHDFLNDPAQLKRGHIYSLILTNNYQTNFYTVQSGDHLFRYSIASGPGPWETVPSKNHGWDVSNPLDAIFMDSNPNGSLPPAHGFLEILPDCLELLALKEAEDGKGLIIRIQETSGKDTEARIRVRFARLQGVLRTDLVEQNEECLPLAGDTFHVRVPRNTVVTLRLIADAWPRVRPGRPW